MIRSLLNVILMVFDYLVLIRCILSFMGSMPKNRFTDFIYAVTEPIMAPFRKLLPPMNGMDFSPLILFLLIALIRSFI